MKGSYIDLHTHSCLSDGSLQPMELMRRALAAIADEFGLMHSCASDFHGNLEGETLAHGFTRALCAPLLEALGL